MDGGSNGDGKSNNTIYNSIYNSSSSQNSDLSTIPEEVYIYIENSPAARRLSIVGTLLALSQSIVFYTRRDRVSAVRGTSIDIPDYKTTLVVENDDLARRAQPLFDVTAVITAAWKLAQHVVRFTDLPVLEFNAHVVAHNRVLGAFKCLSDQVTGNVTA